ncbi:Transposase and inactivated derivative [Paramagnetospirillum magneticum AMB-1]|uniref:Transposase and inactivated derivative n=1 Tax=Paramagnetospirillum magneticum (strain ATCC 700264 / AMB-1) TaxID=342108 RepID=Q2WAB7_PARM1|nr:Transposase and inactivated derivative [Paramagnetospirillum magneticum AMB-1]
MRGWRWSESASDGRIDGMVPDALPTDIVALQAIIATQADALAAAQAGLMSKTLEVEKLRIELARLRRMQFGRSSEKISRAADQLELMLEDVESSAADVLAQAEEGASDGPAPKRNRARRPLPSHLPRTEVVHDSACTCPSCGGAMRKVGEDVTEILDYVPGRFQVIRHIRPAYSCRACEGTRCFHDDGSDGSIGDLADDLIVSRHDDADDGLSLGGIVEHRFLAAPDDRQPFTGHDQVRPDGDAGQKAVKIAQHHTVWRGLIRHQEFVERLHIRLQVMQLRHGFRLSSSRAAGRRSAGRNGRADAPAHRPARRADRRR